MTRIVHIVKRALSGLALAVSVASLATGCTITRLWQPTDEQVLRRILPSAVQVVLEQPEGRRFRTASGVIIAARPTAGGTACFMLTAGHTFTGARGKAVYVIVGSHEGRGTKVPATVLFERETDHLDLALLKAENVDRCTPARVKRPAMLGEWAWVVAFPWGSRLTLARGVVSQIDRAGSADRDRDTRLMVDASVSYGASGAGVYEARAGRLIGVVEGYSTTRVSSQGGGTPWYIDVPMPGQTLVTSLHRIWRFLEETGNVDLIGGSSPPGPGGADAFRPDLRYEKH